MVMLHLKGNIKSKYDLWHSTINGCDILDMNVNYLIVNNLASFWNSSFTS